eukprot:PhF_6_TR21174/c0_g1_i1/m.30518
MTSPRKTPQKPKYQNSFEMAMIPTNLRMLETWLPNPPKLHTSLSATPPLTTRTRSITNARKVNLDKVIVRKPTIRGPTGVFLRGVSLGEDLKEDIAAHVRNACSAYEAFAVPTWNYNKVSDLQNNRRKRSRRRMTMNSRNFDTEEFFVLSASMCHKLRCWAERAKQRVTLRLIEKIEHCVRDVVHQSLLSKCLKQWRNTFKVMRFGGKMRKRDSFTRWQTFVSELWLRRREGFRRIHTMFRATRLGRLFLFWRRFSILMNYERKTGKNLPIPQLYLQYPSFSVYPEWDEWHHAHNEALESVAIGCAAVSRVHLNLAFQRLREYVVTRKQKAIVRAQGWKYKTTIVDKQRSYSIFWHWRGAYMRKLAGRVHLQTLLKSSMKTWMAKRNMMSSVHKITLMLQEREVRRRIKRSFDQWKSKFHEISCLEVLGTLQTIEHRPKALILGYYFFGHLPYFYVALGFRLWRKTARRAKRFMDFIIHLIHLHNDRIKRLCFSEWKDVVRVSKNRPVIGEITQEVRELKPGIRWKHLNAIEKKVRSETTETKLATYNLHEMEGLPSYTDRQNIKLYVDWFTENGSLYSEVIVMQIAQAMVAYARSVTWAKQAQRALINENEISLSLDESELDLQSPLDLTPSPADLGIRAEILKEQALMSQIQSKERFRRVTGAKELIAKLCGMHYNPVEQTIHVHGLRQYMNQRIALACAIWTCQRVRGKYVLNRHHTRTSLVRLHHVIKIRNLFTCSPGISKLERSVLSAAMVLLSRWILKSKKYSHAIPEHVLGCLLGMSHERAVEIAQASRKPRIAPGSNQL